MHPQHFYPVPTLVQQQRVAIHIFLKLSHLSKTHRLKMPARRNLRSRNVLTSSSSQPAPPVSSRPRRAASGLSKEITIARESPESPDSPSKGIHLKVSMPSNKLREATSTGRKAAGGLSSAAIVSGPRSNRAKKSYVVESESDEQDEEADEPEEDIPIEDQIGEPEATDDDINSHEDGSGEEDVEAEEEDEEAESDDAAADEDAEMEDESPMPPPPVVKIKGPPSKPSVTVTPAQTGKLKSVEAKEMEMEEEDEELSTMGSDGEEDAEGDDLDEMDQGMEGDLESGLGSRASTPDPSKMTKRQLGRQNRIMEGNFLQLPMGKPNL